MENGNQIGPIRIDFFWHKVFHPTKNLIKQTVINIRLKKEFWNFCEEISGAEKDDIRDIELSPNGSVKNQFTCNKIIVKYFMFIYNIYAI